MTDKMWVYVVGIIFLALVLICMAHPVNPLF